MDGELPGLGTTSTGPRRKGVRVMLKISTVLRLGLVLLMLAMPVAPIVGTILDGPTVATWVADFSPDQAKTQPPTAIACSDPGTSGGGCGGG